MGGATRHFETLLEDLRNDERFSVRLINTSRQQEDSNPLRNVMVVLKTIYLVIRNLRHIDIISFHASNRGMFLFGPVIVGLGKLFRRQTVIRIFGGSFGDFYMQQNKIGKAVIRKLILSADVVLLQTKRAIEQLEQHASGRLEWFSTYVRKSAQRSGEAVHAPDDQDAVCEKFVFLGHLWKNKGIEIMLEAASRLPGNVSIDIFGPLDEYTEDDIKERGMGRVRYCGFLTHAEVDTKLWEYDCLVLPTFHPSEGYPGVIAEAFTKGLPVIATNWLAIPEIVDDECGILIPPRDTAALVTAITALASDRARWRRLCEGARARAAQFDHKVWSGKFYSICEELVGH
jgi:glycosyltransferase involved in cell wall biosynthesis